MALVFMAVWFDLGLATNEIICRAISSKDHLLFSKLAERDRLNQSLTIRGAQATVTNQGIVDDASGLSASAAGVGEERFFHGCVVFHGLIIPRLRGHARTAVPVCRLALTTIAGVEDPGKTADWHHLVFPEKRRESLIV